MGFKLPLPRKRQTQAVLASAAALVGCAGLAFAQVQQAVADPTTQLVAVGSDTIQDVYNQFALDLSGNALGSYDAVNPVSAVASQPITPVDGFAGVNCSFNRPNGSGQGLAALRESINPGSVIGNIHGTAAAPQPGCVDIARSSNSVTQDGHQDNAGALVFIPFALDAVAGATGGTAAGAGYSYSYTGNDNAIHTVTATPAATVISQADAFTLVDLINLYKNCEPITENAVTYWPLGSPHAQPGGSTVIDLYVPQSGSGTAKFWAATLGFSLTSLPACVHQIIVGGPLAGAAAGGVPVEEHNGTPMTTDPNGFGPFSIAQWIAQNNGHNDRRHGAVVHSLANCTAITTGDPATGTCTAAVSPFTGANLNTGFPITRNVYSVASFARVTNASDPLFGILNNASGLNFLCTETAQIRSFGFATIGASCGAVLTANRSDS
jgi:ABC-type phosphate transport system substrate-binding protein